MNRKKYKQFRILVSFFVLAIVGLAMFNNSYLLAVAGIFTGMIFMVSVRSKVKIVVDEREQTIQEKAAQLTYSIFAPTLGIGSFLLLFPSYSGLAVFSKGEFLYLESLGLIFAYLALFLITLYALSYYFLNRKYGGNSHEK